MNPRQAYFDGSIKEKHVLLSGTTEEVHFANEKNEKKHSRSIGYSVIAVKL